MDLSERSGPSLAARHPWEVQRFQAYRQVLRSHGALSACRVLDVGAGDGWFAQTLIADLPQVTELVCWDVNYSADELAAAQPPIVRTTTPPTPGFDLVLALDVLEHIEHPDRFIMESLAPLTAPGTPVLVAVPAHPRLFSNHDRALGHHRRYRPERLLSELAPWIDVVEQGPLFASLVPLRAATVAIERATRRTPVAEHHGVGAWEHGPWLSRLVAAPLAADTAIVRRVGPVRRRLTGLSHWAYGYSR